MGVRTTAVAADGLAGLRRWLVKGMYGVNVVGAGLPGLAILISPGFVAEYVFGAAQDPVALRMLGAVWLSVGALSVLGFRRPSRFAAIFPVEALYKSVWLATAAPVLFAGDRPELTPVAALFAVWVAADLVATPWTYLFGDGSRYEDRSSNAGTE